MTAQENQLRKRILHFVRTEGGTTAQLVSKLRMKDPDVSEAAARRMVWRLVDRGQLSLTQNRTLMMNK